MAVMELTLGGLKFANVYGFERDFGTKKNALTNGGSLTTKEFNEANALPFDLMRPTLINETTNILSIDYDAKLNLASSSEITLTVADGKYIGQTVTVINSSSIGHKVVINGESVYISARNRVVFEWYGDDWESEDLRAVGTIKAYGGLVAPVGYLLCDGEEVLKSAYPTLYKVIGDRYGTAEDTSKFKLPDYRDKVPQGASETNAVGTELEAGLPNITGSIYNGTLGLFALSSVQQATGAFKDCPVATGYPLLPNEKYPQFMNSALSFNASKSNAIYGKSATVQMPAQCSNYIIKC